MRLHYDPDSLPIIKTTLSLTDLQPTVQWITQRLHVLSRLMREMLIQECSEVHDHKAIAINYVICHKHLVHG